MLTNMKKQIVQVFPGSESESVICFNHYPLFATQWTIAHQAHLSMEFSRHEYWNGEPFPSPGDPPDPGVKPGFPTLQADSSSSEPFPGRGNSKFKGLRQEYVGHDMMSVTHGREGTKWWKIESEDRSSREL